MKRKDFQEIEEDFPSPFNSHPVKSRRLNGELLQEESPRFHDEEVMGDYFELEPQIAVNEVLQTEAMPLVDDPHERAIVLYQPAVPRSLGSPDRSYVLNSDLIPDLRDLIFGSGNQKHDQSVDDERAATKQSIGKSNDSLAVIPWVSPQPLTNTVADGQATAWLDAMESEDTEMMDTDEPSYSHGGPGKGFGVVGGSTTEGKESQLQWTQQQQQQQQLQQQWMMMLPGAIQKIYTPIT